MRHMVWTREETRPTICRKKDTGDGSTILGRSFEHCVLNGEISEQLVMRREWAKPIYRGWHNVRQERRREEQCVSSLRWLDCTKRDTKKAAA